MDIYRFSRLFIDINWESSPGHDGLSIEFDPTARSSVFVPSKRKLITPLFDLSPDFRGKLSVRAIGILVFCARMVISNAKNTDTMSVLAAYRTQCRFIFAVGSRTLAFRLFSKICSDLSAKTNKPPLQRYLYWQDQSFPGKSLMRRFGSDASLVRLMIKELSETQPSTA